MRHGTKEGNEKNFNKLAENNSDEKS